MMRIKHPTHHFWGSHLCGWIRSGPQSNTMQLSSVTTLCHPQLTPTGSADNAPTDRHRNYLSISRTVTTIGWNGTLAWYRHDSNRRCWQRVHASRKPGGNSIHVFGRNYNFSLV